MKQQIHKTTTNEINAKERLLCAGYDDITCLENYSYDDALIGVSEDGRAIYDYCKMVEWLINTQDFSETDAIEWIDYNTLRALPYGGHKAPIIMYPI